MKPTVTHSTASIGLPLLSSQKQGWENILVEQFQFPAGEASCQFAHEHVISLSLASRPVRLLQIQGKNRYTGLYSKGDIAITPAQVPLFARWESDDHLLQIRIAAAFIQSVAGEMEMKQANQLELWPEFHTRDPQLEAIGTLLLAELQQPNSGSRLYVDSLTNALTIHLLRRYATARLPLPLYEGGLSPRQLSQVLDYIHDHLDQEIKLADLASLLEISQVHFSHLFKQTIGLSPYQYLLQQRIERAKQLLKQSNRSILEIALLCGFNSHSHLSKQFRQMTGVTPTAYRAT